MEKKFWNDILIMGLIMTTGLATPAASLPGQNVQASDKYGIRGLWSASSVAESGRYGQAKNNGQAKGMRMAGKVHDLSI